MFDDKLLHWNDALTIEKLKKSLSINHVSITSTDTVLGFLAPLTEQGYQSLHAIKGSRTEKHYVILIAAPGKLSYFVDEQSLDKNILRIIDSCWPGPLTIVFKAKKGLPRHLVSADGTIALRCPRHDGLLKILFYFDGLFSTSANKSGQIVASSLNDLPQDLAAWCDYIVVDEQEAKTIVPSTIIDVSQFDTIRVVREGAYSSTQLEKIVGIPIEKCTL